MARRVRVLEFIDWRIPNAKIALRMSEITNAGDAFYYIDKMIESSPNIENQVLIVSERVYEMVKLHFQVLSDVKINDTHRLKYRGVEIRKME